MCNSVESICCQYCHHCKFTATVAVSNTVEEHIMQILYNSEIQLTRMPSSSLTLLIILTHISGIFGKSGCSMQMSRKIFMTRFLTLMPVSCETI